jgi:WD40 repeat protein
LTDCKNFFSHHIFKKKVSLFYCHEHYVTNEINVNFVCYQFIDLQDAGSESDRTVCSAGGSSVSKERSRSTVFLSYPKADVKKPLEMKSISSLRCHNSEINDVCASSNGQYFATAGSDGVVKTFEMSTTRHLLNLKGSSPIICLDISNDQGEANQWIAGGGSDGTCRVWNLHTGAMKFQISGHASKVHGCKFVGMSHFFLRLFNSPFNLTLFCQQIISFASVVR